MSQKIYTPVATYPSKSNPSVTHTVHVDQYGELSCTCNGWCKRPPPRECTHTRQEEEKRRRGLGYWSGDPAEARVATAEPVVQAGEREKGGSLTDLFTKLSQGDK